MEKSLDYIGFIIALIAFGIVSFRRFLKAPEERPRARPLHPHQPLQEFLHTLQLPEEEPVEKVVVLPPPPETLQEYEEKEGLESHHMMTEHDVPEVEVMAEEALSLRSLLEEQKHPIALILFHDLLSKPKSW